MIDVRRSPELRAAIFACKRVDADLRKAIYAASRTSVNALWKPAVAKRATDKMTQRIILKGTRAAIRTDGFSLFAASSKKPLRGGLVPATQWQSAEFGARVRKVDVERRSRLGKTYRVSQTINRQFRTRQKEGRVAYDAASEVGTKTVVAWVQAVVTTIVNATGGERS